MSALAGIPFPAVGAVLGPLIIWQMKRNEFPSVEEHGKESFNFQLSVLIYVLVGGALGIVGAFFCFGWFLLPLVALAHYGAIVFGVVAGIKANEGVLYRYPLNLRLIK
jgi:hypothetical protein